MTGLSVIKSLFNRVSATQVKDAEALEMDINAGIALACQLFDNAAKQFFQAMAVAP